MQIVKPSALLMWVTPEPAKLIERAARTCYKSEDKITDESASAFVKMLDERKHHAMLEHACAQVRFITDRGISHEIVRHRIASYAQESTRYCNYSKDKFGQEISVIEPSDLSDASYHQWHEACLDAEVRYFKLIEYGCKPQIARSVLPTCLKTEIVMTCNLREWMHFLSLRTAKAAHPDIRILAYSTADQLAEHCPELFKRFKKNGSS